VNTPSVGEFVVKISIFHHSLTVMVMT